MDLVAFRAAQAWIQRSRACEYKELPTPLQYGIALKVTSNPGVRSIWSYLRYLQRKQRTVPRMVVWLGTAMVAQVSIGFLVAVSDTWLHLSATTVPWETVVPVASPTSQYSRVRNCTRDATGFGCAINVGQAGNFIGIEQAGEGIATVNGISTLNAIPNLQGDDIVFLAPAQPANTSDFNATTHGARSQCVSIGDICQLFAVGNPPSALWYNCNGTFPPYPDIRTGGDNQTTPPYATLAEGSTALMNVTIFDGNTNPSSVAVAMIIDSIPPSQKGLDGFAGIYTGSRTGGLLWCEIEVLDIVYSVVKGQYAVLQSNRSADDVAFDVLSVLYAAHNWNAPSVLQPLWLAAEVDAVSANSNTSLFTSLFAKDLSRITIGLSAGILTPSATLEESVRTATVVARLPKSPLFMFVGTMLLFTLLSLTLAALSVLPSGSRVDPRELKTVQGRLVDHFGIVQECFGDSSLAVHTTAQKMFRDPKDPVLRVRQPDDYCMGQAMVFELCNHWKTEDGIINETTETVSDRPAEEMVTETFTDRQAGVNAAEGI